MRRPSQNLPDGCPKKDSPFGGGTCVIAAEIPPVSEFESPKLYTAGNPHPFKLAPPIVAIGPPMNAKMGSRYA